MRHIMVARILKPRAMPLLYPINQLLVIVAPGPNVSHAQARSYMRCMPIHMVCGPGSLFSCSMYPPKPAIQCTLCRRLGGFLGGLLCCVATQTAFHSDASKGAS